jgi:hypothetical protein
MYRPSLELVNSEFFDGFGGGEDRLDKPDWCHTFLQRVGHPGLPDRGARAPMKALRTLMRGMLEEIQARSRPTQVQMKALNAHLSRAPMVARLDLDNGELVFEPTVQGVAPALARITLDFARPASRPDCRSAASSSATR